MLASATTSHEQGAEVNGWERVSLSPEKPSVCGQISGMICTFLEAHFCSPVECDLAKNKTKMGGSEEAFIRVLVSRVR